MTSDLQISGRRFSVAPMMDCTDRHCRRFMRLISGRALLYTEMITTGAILKGPGDRLLAFDQAEHPVALQLGGSDPAELADAAMVGCERGYDEINLNVGCPSDRVSSGSFGAQLMADPDRVARAVRAMADAVQVPVTVKCRIGIDDQDVERDLDHFVQCLLDAGLKTLIVHARKAWLKGLSPKENRTIPPLNYDRVYRLKERYPDLFVVLNGGIVDLESVQTHLDRVDGVMLGRAAYQTPYLLADVDSRVFGESTSAPGRVDVLRRFLPYMSEQLDRGVQLHRMTKHLLGLFHGQPGARGFRRLLSTEACKPDADTQVVERAIAFIETAMNRSPSIAAE